MHLAITLLTILATWRWADWRNWTRYQSSMFYIAAGGLLYEYLTKYHTMWRFHSDFLYSHRIVVIIYALVTMPLTVLIFLSRFPAKERFRYKLRYYGIWIAVYIMAEHILRSFGFISYENGWTFWYSLLFDMMMFPMIRLHHRKPGLALFTSVGITVFLMLWFKVPVEAPPSATN